MLVDESEFVAGGEHLGGQAADQVGGHLLAGHGDLLRVRRLQSVLGDRGDDRVLDVLQLAQVREQAAAAGARISAGVT